MKNESKCQENVLVQLLVKGTKVYTLQADISTKGLWQTVFALYVLYIGKRIFWLHILLAPASQIQDREGLLEVVQGICNRTMSHGAVQLDIVCMELLLQLATKQGCCLWWRVAAPAPGVTPSISSQASNIKGCQPPVMKAAASSESCVQALVSLYASWGENMGENMMCCCFTRAPDDSLEGQFWDVSLKYEMSSACLWRAASNQDMGIVRVTGRLAFLPMFWETPHLLAWVCVS